MNVAQYTWHRQARTEYMAAALTAQACHWMLRCGLSPDTLTRSTRVVADEVRHSAQCHELYLLAGGDPAPLPIADAQLSHADDPDAELPERLLTAVGELAVEESVALAVFRLRLANATQPRVREVVSGILTDEAFHRAFAWDVLDELVEHLGLPRVRAWVRPRLAWWVRIYATTELRPDEPVFTVDELGFGLIDRRRHWAAMAATVRNVVLPRFRRRGLLEDGVGLPELRQELRWVDGRPAPPWVP